MFDVCGKVVKAEFLNSKIKFVRVELLGEFGFKSGQFVNVEVAPQFYRSYSIASPSIESKKLEFVVDISPGGKGSQFFEKINLNDEMHIKGPFGRLVIPGSVDGDLCFIATGTGIAPFRSIVLELLEKGFNKKIFFYWGLRYKDDIFFEDELKDLSKKLNFKYCISLSRPDVWDGETGHITECLKEKNFDNNTLFYLCGNNGMIDETKRILAEKNIGENNIRFEKFY